MSAKKGLCSHDFHGHNSVKLALKLLFRKTFVGLWVGLWRPILLLSGGLGRRRLFLQLLFVLLTEIDHIDVVLLSTLLDYLLS